MNTLIATMDEALCCALFALENPDQVDDSQREHLKKWITDLVDCINPGHPFNGSYKYSQDPFNLKDFQFHLEAHTDWEREGDYR